MVSRVENDVFIATENNRPASWLGLGKEKYANFLNRLDCLIQGDYHFEDIAWFATGQKDYKNPSFQHPVIN